MSNQHPLVLVFYLDRTMLSNPSIARPFTDSVNKMIYEKNLNMVCFFLPTDGEETIKCLNPVTIGEEKMLEINQLIEDIRTNFSIGEQDDMNNIPNIEI